MSVSVRASHLDAEIKVAPNVPHAPKQTLMSMGKIWCYEAPSWMKVLHADRAA